MTKSHLLKCQVVITLVEIEKEEWFQSMKLCPFSNYGENEDLNLQTVNQTAVLGGYWACYLKKKNPKTKRKSFIKTEEA